MMLSASVYRIWENVQWYIDREAILRKHGLRVKDPYILHQALIHPAWGNPSNPSHGFHNIMQGSKASVPFNTIMYPNHMPFEVACITPEDILIRDLMDWTHMARSHGIKTSLIETGKLNYAGRDNYINCNIPMSVTKGASPKDNLIRKLASKGKSLNRNGYDVMCKGLKRHGVDGVVPVDREGNVYLKDYVANFNSLEMVVNKMRKAI
jgi:hypothetical protein